MKTVISILEKQENGDYWARITPKRNGLYCSREKWEQDMKVSIYKILEDKNHWFTKLFIQCIPVRQIDVVAGVPVFKETDFRIVKCLVGDTDIWQPNDSPIESLDLKGSLSCDGKKIFCTI